MRSSSSISYPHPHLTPISWHRMYIPPASASTVSLLTSCPLVLRQGWCRGQGTSKVAPDQPAFFSSDHFICYKPPILQHQIIGVQAAPRVLGERVTAPPLPYKRCSRTVHLTLSPGCHADPKALFLLPNLCSYGLE